MGGVYIYMGGFHYFGHKLEKNKSEKKFAFIEICFHYPFGVCLRGSNLKKTSKFAIIKKVMTLLVQQGSQKVSRT